MPRNGLNGKAGSNELMAWCGVPSRSSNCRRRSYSSRFMGQKQNVRQVL